MEFINWPRNTNSQFLQKVSGITFIPAKLNKRCIRNYNRDMPITKFIFILR